MTGPHPTPPWPNTMEVETMTQPTRTSDASDGAVSNHSDTIPVEFTVRQIEAVHGRGALMALATVDVSVCGVDITLQGVQVVQAPSGALECRAPVFKDPSRGTWLPGVLLPPELAKAMGVDVLEAWRAHQGRTRAAPGPKGLASPSAGGHKAALLVHWRPTAALALE